MFSNSIRKFKIKPGDAFEFGFSQNTKDNSILFVTTLFKSIENIPILKVVCHIQVLNEHHTITDRIELDIEC